jgi:hypothetical protein
MISRLKFVLMWGALGAAWQFVGSYVTAYLISRFVGVVCR